VIFLQDRVKFGNHLLLFHIINLKLKSI